LDRVKDEEGKGKISCVACQLQKARTVFPRRLSYTYRIVRTKGKGNASGKEVIELLRCCRTGFACATELTSS
jgi:hypothetical protein